MRPTMGWKKAVGGLFKITLHSSQIDRKNFHKDLCEKKTERNFPTNWQSMPMNIKHLRWKKMLENTEKN